MRGARVLVTGASGFIGRRLCAVLLQCGYPVRGALRGRSTEAIPAGVETIEIGSLDGRTNWHQALVGCDTVVHLAARVHVMHEQEADPLAAFRVVNVEGTLNLARQALAVGVRRFIFISSIGVNGGESYRGPYTANDTVTPHTPYAKSKHEAEIGLQALCGAGMELIIIRPPIVYGPEAPGNFESLMRWLWRGFPLPLGAVRNNRRSLVYLDNLVDLIVKSIDHPAAANQTFLVSDGEDLSTTQLVKRLSKALGKPARLIPLPVFLLKLGALMFGKSKIAQNLCGSLQVDIAKTQQLLGWNPPISVEEGLRCTAAHWAVSHRKDPTISGRGSWIIKRVFDLLLGLTATLLLALPLLVISGLVRLTSKGPILYWSDRVGRNNVIFRMPKFRSMRIGTPVVATHLLQDPNTYLTPIGSFLRKSSMDELPQLWSILKGDLSFVGPRPALFNQADLIALRTEQGVHLLMPGLTGWAQVNGRDELPIPEKVKLDVEYLHRRSFWFDLQILWLTGAKVFSRDGVSH